MIVLTKTSLSSSCIVQTQNKILIQVWLCFFTGDSSRVAWDVELAEPPERNATKGMSNKKKVQKGNSLMPYQNQVTIVVNIGRVFLLDAFVHVVTRTTQHIQEFFKKVTSCWMHSYYFLFSHICMFLFEQQRI